MEDDPRKAATLGEACANGDGTFNGLRLLSWLSGIPLKEVSGIAEKVKAEKVVQKCAS